MRYAAIVLSALSLLCASQAFAEQGSREKNPQSLEKRIIELEKEVSGLQKEVDFLRMPPLPDQVTLCGKSLPLSNDDVRERFEREFYLLLEHKGQLTLLVKRHAKFFSLLSDEINAAGMPSDLIYLAIAESSLNPRSNSPANAGGMWQFIKDTGQREGLCVNEQIDERYSVKKSTRSALGYLKKLHAEFGDWFIAMAAYNAGEARLREAVSNQNARDFFDLFLPQETDRYIFRIAAIKEVLGNPDKYGLLIEKKDYYRPYAISEVVVVVAEGMHTAVLAQAMDLPYRTFREYNLHMRKYKLPRGAYHLYIPVEKKDIFLTRIKNHPDITLQE